MVSLKVHLCHIAIVAIFVAFVSECDGVKIVSRKKWVARPPRNPPKKLTRVPTGLVVIHHGASPACTNQDACMKTVRDYQNHHMNTNNWDDIGYNFLVGEDGNVYEGRGWNVAGAHAVGVNGKSVGICVIGNFTNRTPNAAAVRAVKELIALGIKQKTISSKYKLVGHTQVYKTECPGTKFYNAIKGWSHYSARP